MSEHKSAERIPTVNISNLHHPKKHQELIDTWNQAFCTYGFVYLQGHGLDELYADFYEECVTFFSRPMQEKMNFCLHKGYGHGGYCPPGIETVADSVIITDKNHKNKKKPDPVENVCSYTPVLETFPCTENGYAGGGGLKQKVLFYFFFFCSFALFPLPPSLPPLFRLFCFLARIFPLLFIISFVFVFGCLGFFFMFSGSVVVGRSG